VGIRDNQTEHAEQIIFGAYLNDPLPDVENVVSHEDPKIGDHFRQDFWILLAAFLDESDQKLSNFLRSVLLKSNDLVKKIVEKARILKAKMLS
jgi:hypothetical protein